MATADYIRGRGKYGRPQAMLWSENSGTLENGFYVPLGYEKGFAEDLIPPNMNSIVNSFIILSDHNRSAISFKPTRIEQKQRMINGRMRSYHIADKVQISTSWNLIPSRSYISDPNFEGNGLSEYTDDQTRQYTIDGGAGGVEMLDWYENHTGSFWVYLSYDKYENFTTVQNISNKYTNLDKYSQILEMYITDFSYSVEKRGRSNHDLWTVSVTLEEV
jgi:hypothetical protein